MNSIKITFTIPSFVVWAFVIAVGYLAIGLIIGIIQNIWVAIHSDAKQDGFFTARRLARIIGIALLWPNDLAVQYRIKILGISEEKVCKLSGPDWATTSLAVNNSVKRLRRGQEVKAVILSGSGKNLTVKGKVTQRFSLTNCSTLAVDGHILRMSNGKAPSELAKPVEVLA